MYEMSLQRERILAVDNSNNQKHDEQKHSARKANNTIPSYSMNLIKLAKLIIIQLLKSWISAANSNHLQHSFGEDNQPLGVAGVSQSGWRLTQDAGWWQGMIRKLAGCAAGKTFYCSERESKESESGLSRECSWPQKGRF